MTLFLSLAPALMELSRSPLPGASTLGGGVEEDAAFFKAFPARIALRRSPRPPALEGAGEDIGGAAGVEIGGAAGAGGAKGAGGAGGAAFPEAAPGFPRDAVLGMGGAGGGVMATVGGVW